MARRGPAFSVNSFPGRDRASVTPVPAPDVRVGARPVGTRTAFDADRPTAKTHMTTKLKLGE
jgi:hypothetical protein